MVDRVFFKLTLEVGVEDYGHIGVRRSCSIPNRIRTHV